MSANNRVIDVFPYERRNAEKIIALSQDIASAKQKLHDFVATLPRSKGSDWLSGHDWLDMVNFSIQLETMLAGSFPELLPVDLIDETNTAGV